MQLVLDASVCLKWYLAEAFDEPDAGVARDLLERLMDGLIELRQPAIWRTEIASVLARKLPRHAASHARELQSIEAEIEDDAAVLDRAIDLAIELDHHLFDTIYHAIALQRSVSLITADEHYYRKARKLGSIVLLRDWRAPHAVAEGPATYRARARKTPARLLKKHR
jgi:predicted nucleic acid-binding protein